MTSLDELAVELGRMGAEATKQVKGVVQRGSANVKREARQFSTGIAHAPRYPRSITYTVSATPTGWVGEIGPENTAENQGFLGYVYEFGNATTPPNAHMGPALDREGPRFLAAIDDVVRGIIR